jgi:hypothetical protein
MRRLASASQRTLIWLLQNGNCALCAGELPEAFEVDHIQPFSQQGSKGGKIAGNGRKKVRYNDNEPTKPGRGNHASYLTARIARDAPAVLQRMKAGEFKSVRAAALEAGIIKAEDPVKLALRAVSKLSPAQRESFYADGVARGWWT